MTPTVVGMLISGGYISVVFTVFFGSSFFAKWRHAHIEDVVATSVLWPLILPFIMAGTSYTLLISLRNDLIHYNSLSAKIVRQTKRLEKKQAKQLPAPSIKIETGVVDYRHDHCHACGQVVK